MIVPTVAAVRIHIDRAVSIDRYFDLGVKGRPAGVGDTSSLHDPTRIGARATAEDAHDNFFAGRTSAVIRSNVALIAGF